MRLASYVISIAGNAVSIHASVKDATFMYNSIYPLASGFNPRICKRCDYTDEFCNPLKRVSIHASVKDATVLLLSLV